MSDNTTKEVAVTWAAIDPTKYAVAGTFTVEGTITESATVKATANVTVVEGLAVSSVSAINTNNALVTLDSATNIQANATFSIVLGTEVDPTTVASANIKLYSINATTGAETQVGLTGIGLDPLDTTNKTIVARPAAHLAKATKYKLVLTTGLKDKTGIALAENKVINFTTDNTSVIVAANGITTTDAGNPAVPLANSNVPATALQANDYMEIQYDTTLDASTVTNANIKVKDLTLGTYVLYTPSLQVGTTVRLLWVASNPLVTGHQYQIEINNVKTAIGDPVANNVIKFTANDAALSLNALTAKDAGDNLTAATTRLYPKISGGTYGYAATYKQGAGLVLTLNGKADATTVTSDNIFLTLKGKTEKVPVAITFNKDEGGTNSVIRIVPTADLQEASDYTLHIGTKVKTAAGTALATELTQDFKTADLTAPTILGVDGVDTVQAGVANNIVIHFSEPVSSATNADAVQALVGNITGAAIGNTNPISITDLTTNVDGDAAGIFNRAQLSQDGKDLTLTVTPTATNRAFRIRIAARNTTTPAAYITDANNAAIGGAGAVNTSIPSTYDAVFTTAKDSVKPTVLSVTEATLTGDAVQSGVTNVVNSQVFVMKVNKQLDAAFVGAIPAANAKLVNLVTGAQVTLGGAGNATLVGANPAGVTYSTLTFTLPGANAPFTADGKYQLTVTGLKDTAANVQDGTFTFDFTVDTTPIAPTFDATNQTTIKANSYAFDQDTVADGTLDLANDRVVSLNNAVGVLVNSPIYVKLNQAVTGLDSTSVVLAKADGTSVPGTVKVDADSLGFTFTPSANLANSTVYTLTIKKGAVVDTVGNGIANDINISFQTVAGAVNPTVSFSEVSTSPFNRSNLDTTIILTFSGAPATGGGTAAADDKANYTLWIDADNDGTINGTEGTTQIQVRPIVKVSSKTVTLFPDTALIQNENYKLLVAPTITAGGAALSTGTSYVAGTSNAVSFFTKATADMTALQSTLGITTATYNASSRVLTINFDRPVDPTTATAMTGTTVPTNFDVTGGVLDILGTPAVSSNGMSVSMVLNASTGAIVPGVTTIAPGAALKFDGSASPATNDGSFGTTAVTVE